MGDSQVRFSERHSGMIVDLTDVSAARGDLNRDDPPASVCRSVGGKSFGQKLHWRMATGYAIVHLGALSSTRTCRYMIAAAIVLIACI